MKVNNSEVQEGVSDANTSMCDMCNEKYCIYSEIISDEITPQELCLGMKKLGLF